MIAYFSRHKKGWTPDNFGVFRERYPQTNWPAIDKELNRTELFQAAWHKQLHAPETLSVVLTPGLFAEWLPQCFGGARNSFQTHGHRCFKTPVSTRYDVKTQSRRIESAISQWLKPNEKFIWCTHSKGGIDALWALDNSDLLQHRCAAIVMVQLPVGHSWVIEDLQRSRAVSDTIIGKALQTRWFREGAAAITKNRDTELSGWLLTHKPKVPVLHAVSWSAKATSWADSWHKRLTRLRAEHAHDGQFFMQDQKMIGLPIVELPELDHAQPVLGGHGLDTGRLWAALAYTAFMESQRLKTPALKTLELV